MEVKPRSSYVRLEKHMEKQNQPQGKPVYEAVDDDDGDISN